MTPKFIVPGWSSTHSVLPARQNRRDKCHHLYGLGDMIEIINIFASQKSVPLSGLIKRSESDFLTHTVYKCNISYDICSPHEGLEDKYIGGSNRRWKDIVRTYFARRRASELAHATGPVFACRSRSSQIASGGSSSCPASTHRLPNGAVFFR